jgi:hypothetical protein
MQGVGFFRNWVVAMTKEMVFSLAAPAFVISRRESHWPRYHELPAHRRPLPIDDRLDGQNQIRLALNLIDDHARFTAHERLGVFPRKPQRLWCI